MITAIFDPTRHVIQIGNRFVKVPAQAKDLDTVTAYARCAGWIEKDEESESHPDSATTRFIRVLRGGFR